MEDRASAPDKRGHRTLAAIVFTDGVNFSAMMAMDEEYTLDLIRRDFRLMKELCRQFEGQVLKTTGDGLLMYFASAVQAVACAQEIQKQMATNAATLDPKDVLTHRIGIHLGDVFFSETDVMGNGVNIAARLQAEAEPGGICISQTVYDVVKNRLGLKAVYLGPRELKNIQEAIPIYQVLLAAQPEALQPDLAASGDALIPQPEPAIAQILSSAVEDELRLLLNQHLGPMGEAILNKALERSHSLEGLIAQILLQVPTSRHEPLRTQLRSILVEPLTAEPLMALVAAASGNHHASAKAVVDRLSPPQQQQLEMLLGKIIGPIAHVVLQQTLKRSHTLEELVESLTNSLPPQKQATFRTQAQELLELRSQSVSTPGSVGQPTALPSLATEIDPAFRERCQRELTLLIGPIAPRLIQRTLATYPNLVPEALIELLAAELPPQQAEKLRQRLLS